MSSLAELTDYYPQPSTDLPVEPLYLPDVNTNDIKLSTGEGEPTRITVRPEPRPEPDGRSIRQKLMGEFGERYQLWPEKIVREGLSAAGDTLAGKVPQWSVDKDTGEVHTSPQMIEKAQEISALAGTGGLASTTDATLGSAPFLRPALKYKDKLYKGKEGQQHMDVIPKELYPEFEQMAMSGEDISHYNFGFVNEKGHFLNREKALEHAINNGLVDPVAGQYGALTSTLMADSSKPGTAIEAMKANPFYSALEHNVSNIQQNKMTGEQWLGTLSNKPGVKPEEMQWTGLQEFLQSKGKEPVTKEQIESHLANNKVELKEVSKGKGELDKAVSAFEKETTNGVLVNGEKVYSNEIMPWLLNGDLKVSELPTNLQPLAKNILREHGNVEPTKYHSYQLPGGENYREMLLTLPNPTKQYNEFISGIRAKYGEGGLNKLPLTEAERAQYNKVLSAAEKTEDSPPYKSSHWEEPNILAHVRMNDRTIDGKKSLHIEEIQSDWHQQGRDKGYDTKEFKSKKDELVNKIEDFKKSKDDKEKEVWLRETNGKHNSSGSFANSINPDGSIAHIKAADEFNRIGNLAASEIKPIHEQMLNASKEYNNFNQSSGGVPDAPFKKSWHELALKRMIREAAEKGYDRLSWTPGEAQAARYDLSKTFDRLIYNPETKEFKAYNKSGTLAAREHLEPKALSEYIGKEGSEKLLSSPKRIGLHTLENADLKIGGEGMKGFYDQIIPKALEKIGKEHGVKVKSHMLETNPKGWHIIPPSETVSGKWMVKSNNYNSKGFHFDTEAEAEANLAQNIAGERAAKPIHYIDIPQSLKDQAMHKGFPLFSKGGHMLVPVDHEPDFGDK